MLQEALDFANEFAVDEHNLIVNDGKFEREALYVPFFYHLMMNGAQEDTIFDCIGNIYDAFKITQDIVEALQGTLWLGNDPYPELADNLGQMVYLAYGDGGDVTILFDHPDGEEEE